MPDTNKYAVIVAGGSGLRMGSPVPKQFLPLCGKPVLYYSIAAFLDAMPGIKVILVLPQSQAGYTDMVLDLFPAGADITIVHGGVTRFHSVQNGLKAIEGQGIVFIHDGVRPLVSKDLINACYVQALQVGSAIPAIPVADSIRKISRDGSSPVAREELRVIQTPQTFVTDIIIPAFGQSYDPAFTDEATVVEAHGGNVYLVTGERNNLKVTTPEDMTMAEALLNARSIDE